MGSTYDLLTSAQSPAKPQPVKVTVESWGDTEVHIMPLSVEEAEEKRELTVKALDAGDELRMASVMRGVVLAGLVEEDGTPVFDAEDEEQYQKFLGLSDEAIPELYSYITSREARKRQKVEATKGNLKKARR